MSNRLPLAPLAALLVLLPLAGCSKLKTEYGSSRGANGRKSLNGFGALRMSYEQAGFRSRDVSRLTERVMLSDTIVWTPQTPTAIGPEVTSWFERWFRQGGRTLVYLVPDAGSEADYWIDTAQSAPPEQRLEYRKRAARSVNERITWRLNRTAVPSNGWFKLTPLEHRAPLGRIGGSWREELGERSAGEADLATEFQVAAYDPNQKQAVGNVRTAFLSTGPSGPGGVAPWMMAIETKPTKTTVEFTSLLKSELGDPIVVEIRSKSWQDSRIIIVAGGSLLTNYALTGAFGRGLAGKIIAESTPPGDQDRRVGFLTSNWGRVPVSEAQPDVPATTGMELLTVWPMSLVTMHGLFFGLVVCLMLFPIFGRPRRIRRAAHSDFGHHLDAVAALMNKTGDLTYARARISEYMKRIHGETSGPWILPDPPTLQASTSLTSKRAASARPGSAEQESVDRAAGDSSAVTDKSENHEEER